MSTHHTVTTPSTYSIPATDKLAVKYAPSSTQLLEANAQLASIGTQPGEAIDPRFRTALALTFFEQMANSRPEHGALALYAALRRARIEGRTALIADRQHLPEALAKVVRAEPLPGTTWLATRVDTALMDLARTFEASLSIDPTFYVREVLDTVELHVKDAFQRGFFAAVGQGNVSRNQYVYVMSQQHSYVRYTTRILGYCVAYAQESNLRKHFSKHLSEEINHEKIIEADLAHLGADVRYVVEDLEPNVSTAQFTLGELALVSHFHDSVLLTAAPLAAEGLTAHLDREFVTALNGLVASWGYSEPEKATRFLASHIDFDSGYDGHFEGSMRLLSAYLTDERKLRRFVSALHAQMNSFLRIYREGMEESELWAANVSASR